MVTITQNRMKRILILFLCTVANIQGNNIFTASVSKEVFREKGNFVVSPVSAGIVLGLTGLGARGQTAREIQRVLHVSTSKSKESFKILLSELKGDVNFTLKSANRAYVQEKYPVRNEFKEVATQFFSTDFQNVNFSLTAQTADAINQWVENQTNHKISKLIKPNVLKEDTTLVLVNAIYFNANWSIPFRETSTRQSEFYKTSGDVIRVDAMYHYNKVFNYYESDELGAKFLELPFNGEGVSMVIVLPNQKDGVSTLETRLDEVVSAPKFQSELLNVALPKFKIQSSIDFVPVLRKLGVRLAFVKGKADFSGICGEKGDLYINYFIQKAYVDVNEGGAEAAAATFISFVRVDSAIEEASKEFIVDRPFVFYIKVGNIIIFVGKVTEPSY